MMMSNQLEWDIRYPAYVVPNGITFQAYIERIIEDPAGRCILQYPCLTAEEMTEIATQVTKNREAYLSQLSTMDIVDTIHRAVQLWRNPDYELRQRAERWLPILTGYDKDMISIQLKRFMRTFRRKELLRFLDEELDPSAVLDEFRPRKSGGMSKAYGPNLIYHIFSGNVPGLPIWSLVMGLLVKSANIGKTSSSEPLMAVLFTQSLREVDAQLADTIAILPWKGGERDLEMAVIKAAEAVIAYGSDETVNQIRAQVPSYKRFISYGHKISFAMVGKEALTPDLFHETVSRIAEDVSTYDQQGCVSPHSIFVEEGGAISSQAFAQLLAAELQRYQIKKPRAVLLPEEAQAIHTVRNRYELEGLNGDGTAVYSSPSGTEWTVIYHADLGFETSPLNRTVHLFGCKRLESVIAYLVPHRQYLQTVGIAVEPERLQQLANALGIAGVNRICAIGQMSRTPAGWHHDGRFNLLDLIRWTDIEWRAEQLAERYDADVE
ncbi:hypothetical protein J2T13_003162 [Paenibacillus sp. DS2015]|uniref:acyl-CoA reductase n=1 Tax=Paenibacillus sp. DS2015 TaxID=3373917 RepID=UPI003D1A253E